MTIIILTTEINAQTKLENFKLRYGTFGDQKNLSLGYSILQKLDININAIQFFRPLEQRDSINSFYITNYKNTYIDASFNYFFIKYLYIIGGAGYANLKTDVRTIFSEQDGNGLVIYDRSYSIKNRLYYKYGLGIEYPIYSNFGLGFEGFFLRNRLTDAEPKWNSFIVINTPRSDIFQEHPKYYYDGMAYALYNIYVYYKF